MLTQDTSEKENKMKPKRTQRQNTTGHKWQGKNVNTDGKVAVSHTKSKSLTSTPARPRPFAGKVFYLDLPSNSTAETLERDIKELGGTVEKFFSKEIKYLVSNKREARYVHCLRQDSPVPSPESGPSSPHPRSQPHRPGSRGDGRSRSQAQTDTLGPSRGKSLVERVVKEQERVQMNKILSNALEWGVKILYIDDILAYVEKKKKAVSSQTPAKTTVKTATVKTVPVAKQVHQKPKGGRISRPFVKVEDSSRHYRPIYLTLSNIPEFNVKTPPPCTPFCVEDKDPPGNKQRAQRGLKTSGSEERPETRKKTKKRGGFCECCVLKYENLTTHLQSERHKAFSRSDEYLVVDKLVSTMRCNFYHVKTQAKRPKCSVSSVLIVPGPCGKTELRPEGELDTTGIIKEEQRRTVDRHGGSYSGHTLKIGSVSGSAAVPLRRTHPDRSRHKTYARKWTCRQSSSLVSHTQTAPQDTEPAAPSVDLLSCFPSRATEAEPTGPVRTEDVGGSVPHVHNASGQNEASLKRLGALTNQPEGCVEKQDSSAFDADRTTEHRMTGSEPEDTTEPHRMTGSEPEDEAEQSLSPVQKIRRRPRVYKRKRRKVETCAGAQAESSMLKLWTLFQSSDDTDVEFLGFGNQGRSSELQGCFEGFPD